MRRVHDLVMEALEGPPKSDALAEYNQGDKSLKDILGVLDKVYREQTSYIALHSELCNMQQAYGKSVKAFYQRMTPIIVQIQEKHAGHLREEELANIARDAFYNGLREEYKPLITHKVDQPDIRESDLLQEVRKIEENEARRWARYPVSLSARNNNNNNNNSHSTTYKGQSNGTGYKGSHYKDKKPDAIGVWMVKANDPDDGGLPAEAEAKSPENGVMIWNDGYYYCLRQQADDVDHHTETCYNCREPGYHWRECPHPLRQALQKAKDHDGIDEQRLNASGDSGAKGGYGPPKVAQNQKPTPAQAQKPAEASYWNDDPRACWLGPANLAYIYLDGIRTWVLLDDVSQINSITPACGKSQDFVVGSLEELASDATGQAFQGIGRIRTGAIGYIVF